MILPLSLIFRMILLSRIDLISVLIPILVKAKGIISNHIVLENDNLSIQDLQMYPSGSFHKAVFLVHKNVDTFFPFN